MYLFMVCIHRLHLTDQFPSKFQHRPDQSLDTHLCPYVVRLHFRSIRPSSPKSLPGGMYLELALDENLKSMVCETTTSAKLPEKVLVILLPFPRQDLSHSEYLNPVQSRETTQNRR